MFVTGTSAVGIRNKSSSFNLYMSSSSFGSWPVPVILATDYSGIAGHLKPAQRRILKVLVHCIAINRELLATEAEIDSAWVAAAIGSLDPKSRAVIEKRNGYPSLITLGLATGKFVDLDGVTSSTYRITDEGRKVATLLP